MRYRMTWGLLLLVAAPAWSAEAAAPTAEGAAPTAEAAGGSDRRGGGSCGGAVLRRGLQPRGCPGGGRPLVGDRGVD